LRDVADQILDDATSNLYLFGIKRFKWEQDLDHVNKKITTTIHITEINVEK